MKRRRRPPTWGEAKRELFREYRRFKSAVDRDEFPFDEQVVRARMSGGLLPARVAMASLASVLEPHDFEATWQERRRIRSVVAGSFVLHLRAYGIREVFGSDGPKAMRGARELIVEWGEPTSVVGAAVDVNAKGGGVNSMGASEAAGRRESEPEQKSE